MLDAFAELGWHVVEVTGYTKDRTTLMRKLRRDIRGGRRFDFCYAECVNSPTAMSDPSHVPLHPLSDPLFFRALHRAGIPTAMFYRDVYWRFEAHRSSLNPLKRLPAVAFHHFDLDWYARFVDLLYLPDLGMAAAVPKHERFALGALPPGLTSHATSSRRRRPGEPLRLLYIGSVSPPYYDVGPLLRAVADIHNVRLVLSCPETERARLIDRMGSVPESIEMVHIHGEGVHELYADADVACLIFEPNDYRDFAMPVKLFEAMGHGTPCLADSHTAAGRFVEANGLGWAVGDESDLLSRLRELVDHPEETEEARGRVLARIDENTWLARARTVVADLTGGQAP